MKTLLCSLLLALSSLPVPAAMQVDRPLITSAKELTPLSPEYTQADLDRMGKTAFDAVKAVAPTKLETLTFRLVERSEMRAVLQEELLPQMQIQFTDEDEAKRNARTTARVMAGAVVAKFATGSGEVLVVRENIFELSEIIGIEELASVEVFEAVLCHEAAHALDNHAFPLSGLFEGVRDTNNLHAINALVEGHAQFVARKACTKNGNMRGFELFTSSIDFVPESEDQHEEYMTRILVSQFSFAYKDGERFIAALVKAKGPGIVAKVFEAPPTESILISEPAWYLDPSLRPEKPYDFEQALARYETYLHDESPDYWTMTKVELLGPQISAAFSVLPKERYEQSVKAILECRVLMAQNGDGDGSMISAALFGMTTGPQAESILELEVAMIAAKKGQMPPGVSIDKSKVEKLTPEDSAEIKGVWVDQIISVGPTDIRNVAVLARRGSVVVELNFVGAKMTKKKAIKIAERLLKVPILKKPADAEVGK